MATENIDQIAILEWVFKGIVSILFTVGGWMWVMLVKKIGEIEKNTSLNGKDLADYKVNVAQTYADKSVIERIHLRIDSVQNGVDDIKTLLITYFKK